MKKLKLFGLGNDDERNYFVFDKTLDFFPLFADFLTKIGVQKSGSFYEYDENSVSLDESIDIVEHIRNDTYDIDLFFGKNRIIVIIRTKIDKEYLLNHIKEFSDF